MPRKKPTKRTHKTTPPPLSLREIRFAQLYVEHGNSTRAYKEAGFEPTPATDNAAHARAWRVLRKRKVREYVQHLRRVAAEAARLTVEEIAVGVANIARADRRKMWKGGRFVPPDRWPDDLADTLEGMEVEEKPAGKGKRADRVRKVKTASRMMAYAKLMEWRGMLKAEPAPEAGNSNDNAADLLVRLAALMAARQPGRGGGGGGGSGPPPVPPVVSVPGPAVGSPAQPGG